MNLFLPAPRTWSNRQALNRGFPSGFRFSALRRSTKYPSGMGEVSRREASPMINRPFALITACIPSRSCTPLQPTEFATGERLKRLVAVRPPGSASLDLERGWKPVSGERPEGFQRKGRDAPQAWLDAQHDSRFPGNAGKRLPD